MNSKLILICGIAMLCDTAFAVDGHMDPHWTYDEQEHWGELSDDLYKPPFPYAECGIGQKQSPVDIDSGNVNNVEKIDQLKPNYVEVPLSLTNNGHTLRGNITKGSLFFGENEYELAQFHFHAPSEHSLNGIHYPMEIHFVNGTADGRMAVVSVFVKSGAFNEVFQEILDQAPQQVGQTVDSDKLIRPDWLLPTHTQHFYTYAGSLTTPPCSEGVQWFILQEPLEVSEKQLKIFNHKFYRGNARGEQKLNGRKLDGH